MSPRRHWSVLVSHHASHTHTTHSLSPARVEARICAFRTTAANTATVIAMAPTLTIPRTRLGLGHAKVGHPVIRGPNAPLTRHAVGAAIKICRTNVHTLPNPINRQAIKIRTHSHIRTIRRRVALGWLADAAFTGPTVPLTILCRGATLPANANWAAAFAAAPSSFAAAARGAARGGRAGTAGSAGTASVAVARWEAGEPQQNAQSR